MTLEHKSFANDNPILHYQKNVLIFNNLTNSIKFTKFIKYKKKHMKKKQNHQNGITCLLTLS